MVLARLKSENSAESGLIAERLETVCCCFMAARITGRISSAHKTPNGKSLILSRPRSTMNLEDNKIIHH